MQDTDTILRHVLTFNCLYFSKLLPVSTRQCGVFSVCSVLKIFRAYV